MLKNYISRLLIIAVLLGNINPSLAAKSRNSSLRTFGDYMQIINPLVAAGFASQEKGVGHFGIIFAQNMLATHGIKLIAKSGKWRVSKRPHIEGKKDRYEGMPSGHTASAWAAASYVRTFSDDYKYWSIPLYATAAVTGYSRIKAKEHTAAQVIGAAVLTELITYVNSKLDWSNEYRSSNFYFGGDEISASFEFRF